ncbi:hypothetical protein ABIC30_006251, partial [Methylobacterium sp. 1030]
MGWQAAVSRPPLMPERWRRTQFMSLSQRRTAA